MSLRSCWRRADVRAGVRAGLALVLAYGIALAMDWQKPLWAGISVVVLAAAPAGAALEKARLRVFGSLAGALVAFCLVAWFPQERWLFLLTMSLWVGVCGFFMRRSAHPYAWQVTGFVAPIIAIGAGPPDGAQFFGTAVERLQETACGILSFTLCAVLIGEPPPLESSSKGLQDCREAILALSDHLDRTLHGRDSGTEEEARLRRAAQAAISQPGAAAGPSAAGPAELRDLVSALHHLWLSLIRAPQGVRLHLQQPAERVLSELRTQLTNPESGTESVAHRSNAGDVDRFEMKTLSLRDRSLLRISNELLAELEQTVEDLSGTPQRSIASTKKRNPAINHHLEDDAIAAAQVVLTMVCGSLLWIFLPDLPTGPTLLTLLAPIALAFSNSFGSPAYKILIYAGQAILIGAVLQILVLTRLSDYSSLAVVLFSVVMAITLWKYSNCLARSLMPIVVLSVLSITNVQAFSFTAILNTAVMWLLIAVIATVVGEVPFSSAPEALFRRLYGRFTRLAACITAGLPIAWGYQSAIGTPSQLQTLIGTLDLERLPASGQQLEALVTGCDDCRFWLETWRSKQQRCGGVADNKGTHGDGATNSAPQDPDQQLSLAITHLEATIQRCEQLWSAPAAEPVGIEASAMESCLGASLHLQRSLGDLATISSGLNWRHWPKPPLPWSGGGTNHVRASAHSP